MDSRRLHEIARSPAAFRDALVVPTVKGPLPFGPALADFQRADFAVLDGATRALIAGDKPPVPRFWIERTKGGSKDTDAAVAMLHPLAFSGRQLRIQIGAFDADQADEVRQIVAQILRQDAPLNRLLNETIAVQSERIVNVRTGSIAEILATDARGSHGSRPDLVLVNELSHIGNQEFAETLFDNLDKNPRGVGLIATNAGFRGTWQHRWREIAQTSPGRWHFSALREPAPWISPQDLEESRHRNSASRYRRLWQGEWVSDTGDALDSSDIEAALTLREPGPRQPRCGYTIGLDLGVRRDHSAMVVLGHNGATRRVFLQDCRSWTPPAGGDVDLLGVYQEVAAAARLYGATIHADPWQAQFMLQLLARDGLQTAEVPFVGKTLDEMARTLLEMFRERRIDLYRDEDLLRDLGRLSIKERVPFGLRLDAPRDEFGHCDRGMAFAIALLRAAESAASGYGGVVVIEPVVYPQRNLWGGMPARGF